MPLQDEESGTAAHASRTGRTPLNIAQGDLERRGIFWSELEARCLDSSSGEPDLDDTPVPRLDFESLVRDNPEILAPLIFQIRKKVGRIKMSRISSVSRVQ